MKDTPKQVDASYLDLACSLHVSSTILLHFIPASSTYFGEQVVPSDALLSFTARRLRKGGVEGSDTRLMMAAGCSLYLAQGDCGGEVVTRGGDLRKA
eukprot:763600-Hanusia_phi.AAC.6